MGVWGVNGLDVQLVPTYISKSLQSLTSSISIIMNNWGELSKGELSVEWWVLHRCVMEINTARRIRMLIRCHDQVRRLLKDYGWMTRIASHIKELMVTAVELIGKEVVVMIGHWEERMTVECMRMEWGSRKMKERSDRSDMGGRTCSCVWDDSHRGEKSKVEGMEDRKSVV